MSLSANYPALAPNLLLDFSNSAVVDPRVTVTRASTATYYNGLTYAKAEENLLLQSQALTTSPWVTTNLSAVGSKTAPDGTATAIEITATGTNGRTRQTVTVVSGQTYTHSMFVRRVTGSGTVTLAILDSGGTALFSTVMSLTSDWQRFTVSGAPAVTSIQAGIIIATSTDAVEVWGAQLEQRSAATAYTATTTQPITNYIQALQTAQNNVPRIDHNPVTNATLGLLIEEQRTNLLTYSEDFANAAWSKTDCSVISNTIVAPDGTLSGDKLIENNAANTGSLNVAPSLLNNTAYSGSVFAKAGEWGWIAIEIRSETTNVLRAWFDISTGAVGTVQSGMTASITSVGNGWYRCVATRTSGPTNSSTRFRLISTNADNTTSTGDGYSGIFIWGAQLEAGAFPTSYIPTTTTALTRNADALSLTGTNFSSWYNQTEGTFFAQASSASATANIVGSSDGTNNNRVVLGTNTGPNSRLLMTTLGSLQASVSVAYTLNTVAKFAGAYKLNSSNFASNGTLGIEDTVCTIPTVDRLSIGTNTSATDFFLNGCISRIAYYPLRNTNAQLQALTG